MSKRQPRNPGPPGGYRIIRLCHKLLPRPVFSCLLAVGSGVAVLGMPLQRRHSREYLRLVLGREPSGMDLWRHFHTFTETLLLRLVGADAVKVHPPQGHGEDFLKLVHSGQQTLYGTFHMGCADIIGFLLSTGPRPVHMVRLKVGNSHDTERLMQAYGGIRLIWVNEAREILFRIKDALDEGGSLAIQCDRSEFSSKTEHFDFLGAKRRFPTAIYHLAALYGLPVAFCFSFLEADGSVGSHACRIFRPAGGSKQAIIEAGHAHFREVLADAEALLRRHPFQWFNFGPISDEPRQGKVLA